MVIKGSVGGQLTGGQCFVETQTPQEFYFESTRNHSGHMVQ